jgi:hypothetical protein
MQVYKWWEDNGHGHYSIKIVLRLNIYIQYTTSTYNYKKKYDWSTSDFSIDAFPVKTMTAKGVTNTHQISTTQDIM